MAREHADRLKDRPEETWAEILRRLRAASGPRGACSPRCRSVPERSDDIPDEPAVRLVIMHPQFRHARGDFDSPAGHFASMAAQGRGTAHRLNRNMVVFLAADAKRYEELDDAVRQYLAWKELAGTEDRIRELELPPQQAAQARKRLEGRRRDRGPADLGQLPLAARPRADDQQPAADRRAEGRHEQGPPRRTGLRPAEERRHAARRAGPQNIRLDLDQHLSSVWSASGPGHVTVGKLWEYYCQYPYLPRLAERAVLERGILAVFDLLIWETQGFAVASGYDEATGRYIGLAHPARGHAAAAHRLDAAGPAGPRAHSGTPSGPPPRRPRPPVAPRRQRERAGPGTPEPAPEASTARARAAVAGQRLAAPTVAAALARSGGTTGGGTIPHPGGDSTGTTPPAPKNTRFYGTVRLDPERYGRDFDRLYQEVIQHLAAPEGVDLEITVEIKAVKKDGFPDDKARIVSENARTLKFDQSGFEDH